MKTIVCAATKGGTGKTSLAFTLAIEAAKTHTVYLADMDPQKSLTDLCERRAAELGKQPGLIPDNPVLLDNIASVGQAVADLQNTEFERQLLIVDTPGSFMDIIREAIASADCVVLPVQPSPLDVLAQEAVGKIVDELGKSDRTLFVLNRVDARTTVDDTLRRIGGLFPNPPVQIKQRIDYSRALIAGRTGPEINKDCADEIQQLLQAVLKSIGKVRHGQKAQHGKRAVGTTAR